MKVVLLQDVARLGRKMEIKDVPAGHATNFLIPRKLAAPATSANIKRAEEMQSKNEQQKEEVLEQFQQSVAVLSENPTTITAEANDKDHLFKGLHASDVAAACNAREGVSVTEAQVVMKEPIKELGSHIVTLQCGDVKKDIQVVIEKA